MISSNENRQIINYVLVGGTTTLISLGTKYGLLFTLFKASNPVQLQIAIIISWMISVLYAYFANRFLVFKSDEKNIVGEMLKFFGARIITLIVESFFIWFFISLLEMNSNIQVIICTLITQVIIFLGNFYISKLIVFK